MNKKTKLYTSFLVGLVLQFGFYLYYDQVKFAPLAQGDYDVSDIKDKFSQAKDEEGKKKYASVTVRGTAHYSYDYSYMADVSENRILIYQAKDVSHPQEVELKQRAVSFFEWLPDRNLALIAMYPDPWKGGRWDVILARYNPEGTVHESDASINDLPRGSKIVDVAYSTATNAVYMKMEVEEGRYRLYRTDANYDTRRIYAETSHIGRIAVFFDEDRLFYDDTEDGIMYTFDGDTSAWRTISPPGRFRFIGIGDEKLLYAARVNKDGEAVAYYTGRLGVGFDEVVSLATPVAVDTVTPETIRAAMTEEKNKQKKE